MIAINIAANQLLGQDDPPSSQASDRHDEKHHGKPSEL